MQINIKEFENFKTEVESCKRQLLKVQHQQNIQMSQISMDDDRIKRLNSEFKRLINKIQIKKKNEKINDQNQQIPQNQEVYHMQMFNRLDSEITKLKNLETVENTTEFNNNSILTSKLPNKCLNNQNKESNGTFSKYKSMEFNNSKLFNNNLNIMSKSDNRGRKNEYAKLFDEPKEGEEGFEPRQLKSTFVCESPTKGSIKFEKLEVERIKKDEESKIELNSNEYENLSNFIIEEVKNEDIDDLENLSNKVNKYLELIHDLENNKDNDKKDKDSKNKNYSKNKNKEYDKKAKNIPEECINLCTQFVQLEEQKKQPELIPCLKSGNVESLFTMSAWKHIKDTLGKNLTDEQVDQKCLDIFRQLSEEEYEQLLQLTKKVL